MKFSLEYLVPMLLFFPAILCIGAVSTHNDFRSGRIRNTWLLAGVVYGVIVYAAAGLVSLFLDGRAQGSLVANIDYYILKDFHKWLVNLLISIIVALALWRNKTWAAGDTKLFICFVVLIPISQYGVVYFNGYFASFFFLLVVFIPPMMLILSRAFVYFIKNLEFSKHSGLDELKSALAKIRIVELSKVVFGFFMLFLSARFFVVGSTGVLQQYLLDQKTILFLSVLMYRWLSRLFREKIVLASFVFCVSTIVFYGIHGQLTQRFFLDIGISFISAVVTMLAYQIFNRFLELYADRSSGKYAPFAHWIFLGAVVTWLFKI